MQVDLPWLLPAVLAVPALVLALGVAADRRRRDRLERFARPVALERLLGASHAAPARRWRLAAVAGLACLALAGPRWGLAGGAQMARGIDIVLALDASASMLAEDERPSRLERMKQEVRRLRAQSAADRIALLAFAGRSYILTPLTTDDGALDLFLENLEPSIVGQAGSAPSRAIRQGIDLLLAADGGADRALVLMTDGEAFEPATESEAAAAEALARGISLVVVGFGTSEGATIPDGPPAARLPKRDASGAVVRTRHDPDRLAAVARAGAGTFIAADQADKATRVRAALQALRGVRRAVAVRDQQPLRMAWFLVPALVLLLVDTWRGASPRRPPATATRGRLAVLFLAALPLACALEPDPAVRFAEGDVRGALDAYRAGVRGGDSSAATRYNLGSTLLGADSLADAVEWLDGVRRNTDGEVRARARFNAALARLRQGRAASGGERDAAMAEARAALRLYLLERPDDRDASWNYELALRPPPSAGTGGGGAGQGPETPADQAPPAGGPLDPRQAEALLEAAAREERGVQGRRPRPGRTPPVGPDW